MRKGKHDVECRSASEEILFCYSPSQLQLEEGGKKEKKKKRKPGRKKGRAGISRENNSFENFGFHSRLNLC